MKKESFSINTFIKIALLTSIWIHISEVFRYFILIMPRVKSFFRGKQNVADMNLKIFMIWTFWDTLLAAILVFVFWMYSRIFGNTNKSILIAGTFVWLSVFVIFWIATVNMGLSNWETLTIALLLSWVEMIVGTWIVSKLYNKNIKSDV